MKLRPYLTFNGNCEEAIELYKKAFQTDVMQIMRFSDIPPSPNFTIPEDYKAKIVQATMRFGDDFIRLSDCGPGMEFNDSESERLCISAEADTAQVQHAFAILAEEGRVSMPLAQTFYSPCAGMLVDKFGVLWNFVANKE